MLRLAYLLRAQRDDQQLPFMTPSDSFDLTLRPYQQQALQYVVSNLASLSNRPTTAGCGILNVAKSHLGI